MWHLYFNECTQEGVYDHLLDSWSSCTPFLASYHLCSYIIYDTVYLDLPVGMILVWLLHEFRGVAVYSEK